MLSYLAAALLFFMAFPLSCIVAALIVFNAMPDRLLCSSCMPVLCYVFLCTCNRRPGAKRCYSPMFLRLNRNGLFVIGQSINAPNPVQPIKYILLHPRCPTGNLHLMRVEWIADKKLFNARGPLLTRMRVVSVDTIEPVETPIQNREPAL